MNLTRGRATIKTVVVPVDVRQDRQYRYNDWVHSNRLKVETAGPELGYLHIAAMGPRRTELDLAVRPGDTITILHSVSGG